MVRDGLDLGSTGKCALELEQVWGSGSSPNSNKLPIDIVRKAKWHNTYDKVRICNMSLWVINKKQVTFTEYFPDIWLFFWYVIFFYTPFWAEL